MGTCALLAYPIEGPFQDTARIILFPTLIADVVMNGVHASGGVVSQLLALLFSVLIYALLIWFLLRILAQKQTANQPPEPPLGGST